jgi:putative SOS response-associated peptidase YedK
MCGRYITPEESDLERHWQLTPKIGYRQRFNLAPSLLAPIVRHDSEGKPELVSFRWGFQPPWAKRSWINARSETVFQASAFKIAAQKRRCLVPAIGWYEWQGSKPPKQPYCHHLDGFRPFAFAGIWTAREINGGWSHNFAILTRPATKYLERIHDRMPVILDPKHYDAWLSPGTVEPATLIVEPTAPVSAYRVSTLVSRPENDGPECLRDSQSSPLRLLPSKQHFLEKLDRPFV